MKRTDQERFERERKRREKRERAAAAREEDSDGTDKTSPSDYVKDLHGRLHFDKQHIYNAHDDDVVELLIEMKEDLPEDKWESVLRSAIRKTKVSEKDFAFNELMSALADS